MSTPITERHIVWLDIETTGLDANDHDIIEFAALRDDTEKSLHFHIWPERMENATPEALEMTGYSLDAWEKHGAIPMAEALPQITAFLEDAILAGQNVSFDENFLKTTAKRYEFSHRMGYHKLDIVTLAIIHLRPLGLPSVSLHHVCNVLGISNEGEHSAMADVQRARAVYRTLVDPSDDLKQVWSFRIRGQWS
jgi:DNA polymerase-3 subunit epsilon